MIIFHPETSGCDRCGQFIQYLFLMRKQVTPLTATLSFRAAKDLIKGILHIGRFYNLFYYVTFSTHFISNYGHTAFNLPGLTSSSLTAYQTLPDACFFSFPTLPGRCYWGLFPSAPRWGQVPGVVRRFEFPSIVVQTGTDIRIRVRGIVIRIRVRHTTIRIRVIVPTKNHTA